MKRLVLLLAAALVSSPGGPAARGAPSSEPVSIDDIDRELSREMAQTLLLADERRYFMEAARTAWRYGEHFYRSGSGIIAPVPFYDYATTWDLGSSLAMLYCARELGFLPQADYVARMKLALGTLSRLALFDGAGFNKDYRVRNAAMVDRHRQSSSKGFGWSVTDIGRLLVWLKIIALHDPALAPTAEAVVRRLDFSRLVKDGYLWGEDLAPNGKRRIYIEGHIGYEQYAAQGFALWGHRPAKALRLSENAIPIPVMGHTVAADSRQRDRLTSEPFILAGLEVGLTPDMRRLARAVLGAQEERARRTGVLTIVSEDALDDAPHYFYYYCIFSNGKHFSIDVQDPDAVVERPRWVSTKAAFGWHALMPNGYTRRALEAVQPARESRGWSSGVYENSGRSTGTLNVNTAAVVMTAALYALEGEPMLARDHRHDHQSAIR